MRLITTLDPDVTFIYDLKPIMICLQILTKNKTVQPIVLRKVVFYFEKDKEVKRHYLCSDNFRDFL